MSQRAYKTQRTIDPLESVKVSKQVAYLMANETAEPSTSGLTLNDQKKRRKRAEDLSWQIKFANMKLRHWKNENSLGFDPLYSLLDVAETEYRDLDSV